MIRNLFRGIIVGLITGMPLGAIGAICLKNTLDLGRKHGLISGLGSAIADTIYAAVAAVGFTIIGKFIFSHKLYFHIFGGTILILFGIHMFLSGKSDKNKKEIEGKILKKSDSSKASLFKSFISTFFLALANPQTIFGFIAVFTGMQMAHIRYVGAKSKILLIMGVFIGSMIWWFILVFIAGSFDDKLNMKSSSIINQVLSVIVIVSGVIIFLGGFNLSHVLKMYIFRRSKLLEKFLKIKVMMPLHK